MNTNVHENANVNVNVHTNENTNVKANVNTNTNKKYLLILKYITLAEITMHNICRVI